MFGYVRARMDTLDDRQKEAYRAAYCGLCRSLGKRFGFRARFLVSYDMTFLYLVRAACGPEPERGACLCPARPGRRKLCFCDASGYGPVADCTVILSWLKLDDNVRDSGFFRSLPYRLLRLFYRRAYRKAKARAPAFASLAEDRLASLRELEAAESDSIDATADCFAAIVSGCGADLPVPELRRPAQALLYQVGRFIYLTDALDDLKKDCRHNRYNPLRRRFRVPDGKLSAEDLTYLTELTESSVNLAGSAAALLPQNSFSELAENVIFRGLSAVFAAVRTGTFRKRRKKDPERSTTNERSL